MPSVCIHVRKTYSKSEEIAMMNAVQSALVTACSIERTSSSVLRPLCAAAHVQR
jgi:hypothetical protein